jgi:membrane-associated phospholipid phosphatase
MKTKHLRLFILFSLSINLYGADGESKVQHPPITLVFHNIGWNALNSVTYNYGLNLIGAGLGTWAFIGTGLDWEWRNAAYNNTWVSNMGRPGLYIGYIVPAITPIVTYTIGRFTNDEKLQITGLALVQSLMLTLAIQTPLKMATGRESPGIVNELDHTRNSRQDDFSGKFNWFSSNFIAGWPSGHTANAFAAAATISEIYKDNIWINIGAYSYAVLIGIGVTLDVHWASEALAGALIGYAVGKTVGKSFRQLLEKDKQKDTVSFYFTPNAAGINVSF